MLLTNVTIKGMDEKNRAVLFGRRARMFDGFVLGVMDRGGSVATCGLDGPFPLVRHNVLIGTGLFCRNLRRSDAFAVFDSTMSLVDDERRTQTMSDLPSKMDGFLLGSMDRGGLVAAFFPDGPFPFVWYNVLIMFGHGVFSQTTTRWPSAGHIYNSPVSCFHASLSG